MTFDSWRIIHRGATAVIGLMGMVHSAVTALAYDSWSPDALWFLGTGLSLIMLAVMNWAHVGLGPCDLPTAPAVKYTNVAYALFGLAAVVAVPEPQAYVLATAFIVQATAGFNTLQAVN